jgi:hypothetical protein
MNEDWMLPVLAGLLCCGFIAAAVASNKRLSVFGYLLLGCCLGVLGIAIALVVPPGRSEPTVSSHRKERS